MGYLMLGAPTSEGTLRKIPQFHLISWYRNFVERHSFRIVRAICEITVFYAAELSLHFKIWHICP